MQEPATPIENKEDIFVGVGDVYNGVTIGIEEIPNDPKQFEIKLQGIYIYKINKFFTEKKYFL